MAGFDGFKMDDMRLFVVGATRLPGRGAFAPRHAADDPALPGSAFVSGGWARLSGRAGAANKKAPRPFEGQSAFHPPHIGGLCVPISPAGSACLLKDRLP